MPSFAFADAAVQLSFAHIHSKRQDANRTGYLCVFSDAKTQKTACSSRWKPGWQWVADRVEYDKAMENDRRTPFMDATPVYADKSVELFMQGYNCCQAVFAGYCGRFGLDTQDGLRLTAGMGGGMGGMREKCGAVTAMFLLAGLRYGAYPPADSEAKKRMYAVVQKLDAAFTDLCTSTSCQELLRLADGRFAGLPALDTASFIEKKPCAMLVEVAYRIVSERLVSDMSDGRT
jgi:C_GCAxxG_C_C family probable redox protein